MMDRPYDMMIAGHLCLDIIPRFTDTGARKIEDLLRPGKLVNIEEAVVATGGPVSNTGISAKRLGNRVCFCACVGDDLFGKLTIDILRESGNADGIRVLSGQSSSYTVLVAPPGIDRIILHNPGPNNLFGAGDIDPELVRQCRHFHFGYPPLMAALFADEGAELCEVFRIAREAGATTSCDMTPPDPASASGKAPWRRILEKLLPYVDILVPSVEEAFYLLHPREFLAMKQAHANAELIDFLTPEDYSRMADELLDMGVRMTTLKAGHRGFYFRTGVRASFDALGAARPGDAANWADRELWVPAFEADRFGSAAGSGDASIAGLLTAYLRGLTIEESLKYAACCGMQAVRVLDAVSGLTSWEDTTAVLAGDPPMMDTRIDAAGWRWSDETGLWSGPADSAAS